MILEIKKEDMEFKLQKNVMIGKVQSETYEKNWWISLPMLPTPPPTSWITSPL